MAVSVDGQGVDATGELIYVDTDWSADACERRKVASLTGSRCVKRLQTSAPQRLNYNCMSLFFSPFLCYYCFGGGHTLHMTWMFPAPKVRVAWQVVSALRTTVSKPIIPTTHDPRHVVSYDGTPKMS